MPEIAEAHIMADHLHDLIGNRILQVKLLTSDKNFNNIHLAKLRTIEDVYAKGKHVIIVLDVGYIYTTLSMTGKWILPGPLVDIHRNYIKLELHCGSISGRIARTKKIAYFSDCRTWGSVVYLDEDQLNDKISKLGPDPLNDELTLEYWRSAVSKRTISSKMIVKFLNDQKVISGIGNYLRVSILYDAKINPYRTLSNLSDEDIIDLYNSIIKICREAYDHGGLSMGDDLGNYISPLGVKGTYPSPVYGVRKCPLNHLVMKEKIKGDGQSIHYCPVEQI